MEFELSEEARLLQQTVRRFVDEELMPLEIAAGFEEENLPPGTIDGLRKKVKDLGLWNLDVPKQFGGGGLDQVMITAFGEESNRALVGRSCFGSGASPALYLASDEMKEKYLYPTLRGEKRGCFAFTDPTSGADPQTMQTNAVRQGDNYVINGRKIFITGAHKSDYAQLVCRMRGTSGRQGMVMFLVDMDTPGLKIERIIHTLGHPSSIFDWPTELSFDDMVVPASNRLGEEGEGFAMAQGFLGRGFGGRPSGFGIRSYTLGKRCLYMARDYAKGRVTFGEPIANRQAVQWMLVDSYAELEMLRLISYNAAWKADRGEDTRNDGSLLKFVGTETLWRVADRAIQIHGGIGLSKDLPLEKIFRDARVDRIIDGPNEVHRFVVARNLLAGRL